VGRSVLFLIALAVLAYLFMGRPRLRVLSATPARALDDAFRPIDPTTTFGPEDDFFVSVELSGYRPGMDVRARWRYEGQVITETTLNAEGQGSGHAGFVLSNDRPPWPVGEYSVEILLDGEPLASTTFAVSD
jgi:hypothetical protein